MARETKAARAARETEERAAADRVWHERDGVWCRREGMWWIVLSRTRKPYSVETAWGASLRYGWTASNGWICASPHLCNTEGVEIAVARALACTLADDWAREVTRDLLGLVQQPVEVAP
jgi:hypothetical protein